MLKLLVPPFPLDLAFETLMYEVLCSVNLSFLCGAECMASARVCKAGLSTVGEKAATHAGTQAETAAGLYIALFFYVRVFLSMVV